MVTVSKREPKLRRQQLGAQDEGRGDWAFDAWMGLGLIVECVERETAVYKRCPV